MTEDAAAGHNRLADLSHRIREAQAGLVKASREAAEHALDAGRLLVEAKAECGHGAWLPFLASAGVPERQAQRLMQLARSGLKPDTVSDLGIKAALDAAGRRVLPKAGTVLVVTAGPGPLAAAQPHAFVWESDEHAGHYHVTGATAEFREVIATRRPVAGREPAAVFAHVDEVFGGQRADLAFMVAPIERSLCEAARLASIEEQDAEVWAERAAALMRDADARLACMTGSAEGAAA